MNGADHATGRRPRTPSARVATELLNAAESMLVTDGVRGLTVRAVAAKAGVIAVRDAAEAAQQIWCALHGAVALELRGLAQTLDPAQTYRALVDTILRGLSGSYHE
jgi:WHG domain-containing protein